MSRTDLDAATLANSLRMRAGDGSIEWVSEPIQASVLLDIADMLEESDKLRELVDGLRYCANESHGHGRCSVRFVDGYVTHCPLYDVDSGTARCEVLMRELRVEVGE